jgi:hypothetical protein
MCSNGTPRPAVLTQSGSSESRSSIAQATARKSEYVGERGRRGDDELERPMLTRDRRRCAFPEEGVLRNGRQRVGEKPAKTRVVAQALRRRAAT